MTTADATPAGTDPAGDGLEEFLEYPPDHTYLVSTHGRLFSTKSNRFLTARQHRGPHRARDAYVWSLQLPAVKPHDQHHRVRTRAPCAAVVWRTFVGPVPAGYTVRPIDGDPARFHLDNLHVVNSMTGLPPDYHRQHRLEALDDDPHHRVIAAQLDDTARLLREIGQGYLGGRLEALARVYAGSD